MLYFRVHTPALFAPVVEWLPSNASININTQTVLVLEFESRRGEILNLFAYIKKDQVLL